MEEWEEKLQHYMEIGAVELAGVDDNGEMIFAITEKAKELAPDLWESHQKHVDESLIELYNRGLITVEYNEDLEAIISISDEGKLLAKEFGIIEMDTDDIPND